MNGGEGWSSLEDYSLFLPDDAFDLFGDCDLNLDFNNFLEPAFGEANHEFKPPGWNAHGGLDPFQPDPHFPLSTLEEQNDWTLSPNVSLHECKHTPLFSRDSVRSSNSEDHASTDGSAASGAETAYQLKATEEKRTFFKAFSISSGEDVRMHTRKRFSEKRKKAVALNRMLGVCLHCRLRKVACNDGIPCDQCIRRAGSLSFGQEICMRRSLVATRFDHIDLFRAANVKQKVKELPIPAEPQLDRWGYIWFPGNYGAHSLEAYIKVPLIHCKPPNFQPHRILMLADYYGKTYYDIGNTTQAISPRSIPSIESLLQAYLISRRNFYSEPSPFNGLYKAFRDFAESYCNMAAALPLKGLLSTILRLQRLFNMYLTLPSIKSEPCDQEGDFVSSAIRMQLRLPICKAIKISETYVLSEIDRMIQSKAGIGRQNPLATWVALWILILSYKEYMIFCKASYSHDHESEKIYCLNQHLYNMLTSTYAALYKTTSPLTLDWRSKEVSQMMGSDPHLINLFCNIKTEMFWFQAYTHELFPEDILFKQLILDNENKLLAAHIKAAKREGII